MSGIKLFLVELVLVLAVTRAQRKGDKYILFADSITQTIFVIDFLNSNYSGIGDSHQRPTALDYDPVQNRVYWTDVGRKDIRSCGFHGENITLVRQLNSVAVPDGLAVDPISRLIFYSDTGNDVIAMMDITDFFHKTIISENLDEPRGIAVDRENGLIYWTDWGSQPKIERATYLGGNRTTLVSTYMIWPNGITLDPQAKQIYWCDARSHTIERIDFDGSNRKVVVRGSSFQPFDVFLFEQVLYTTAWDKSSIHITYLDEKNTSDTAITATRFSRPGGIHVMRGGTFQNDSNGCTMDKGGCEHLCIPVSGGKQCACADNWGLEMDGKSCVACEVNVTYGANCNNLCEKRHCVSSSSSCDVRTGTCDAERCQPGWQGDDCTRACEMNVTYGANCNNLCEKRHCVSSSSSCDVRTGTCDAERCQPGWQGDDCTRGCSADVKYSFNCEKFCDQRHCAVMTSPCSAYSGRCVGGCLPGWKGDDCVQECLAGVTYGSDCGKQCSERHCLVMSSCDKSSGSCVGGCQPGFKEPDCSQTCLADRYKVNSISYE